MSLAFAVGVAVLILSASLWWPQALRISRTRNSDGVSAATVTGTVGVTTIYLLYGYLTFEPVMFVSQTSTLAAMSITVLHHHQRKAILRAAPVAVAAAFLPALHSTGALLAVGSVACFAAYMPQVWLALRTPASRLTGLALPTYLIGIVLSGLWIAYALAIGRPEMGALPAALIPANLTLATRAWQARAWQRRQIAAIPSTRQPEHAPGADREHAPAPA